MINNFLFICLLQPLPFNQSFAQLIVLIQKAQLVGKNYSVIDGVAFMYH